ncbi:MAG: aspartate 1-decarboxylase [Desulfovibrionales bacterium]
MALRCFLNGKIHRATITGADRDYEGSLAVDRKLLQAAGIAVNEQVEVYNLDNGERLTTYAIVGEPGEICLNGAAALKGEPGQRVIIAAYVWLDNPEVAGHCPRVVFVDGANRIRTSKE